MLSKTSKMPCKSISRSAWLCITGSKLAEKQGSVCWDCYARKGFYHMPSVKAAMEKREVFFHSDSFVETMIELIGNDQYFRWFDSGDVENETMANNILDVCTGTPNTQHWIPTKEYGIWRKVLKNRALPNNVVLRASSPMIDEAPLIGWSNTSTVHTQNAFGHECQAYNNGGKCGDCRACWDRTIENVSYKEH